MKYSVDYCPVRIFSLRQPLTTLVRIIFLVSCFVLTVFGTYGTMRGGVEVTNENYLIIAYPTMVSLYLMLLLTPKLSSAPLKIYVFRYTEGVLLLAFYTVLIISLISAPQKIIGSITALFGSIVTVLTISNYVKSRERFLVAVRLLCYYLWFTGLIAFAAGVKTFYDGPFEIGPIYIEYNEIFWRVNSWFLSSTSFGLFLTYSIVAALYLRSVFCSPLFKLITLTSIPFLIFGMILSGARTSFVTLSLSLLLLSIIRLYLQKKLLYGAIFFSVVSIIIIILSAPFLDEFLVFRRFLEDGDTTSLGGRGDMWDSTLPIFFDFNIFQFFFGSGLGTFQEAVNSQIGAHSGFLRILVEHGILGLIFSISFLTILCLKIIKLMLSDKQYMPERGFLLMLMLIFFSSEVVVQQLMGVSMETIIFFTVVGLVLSDRRLRLFERRHLRRDLA